MGRNETERARIGHRCDQLAIANAGHATHDDRGLNAEHFGNACLHNPVSSFCFDPDGLAAIIAES